ncbi:hypothetical protein [Mesorhizobium sp.]|uniref:hypothetical protein n=1 Tax=Mesorhizobium sp. TaxID=1871066 RepID=UPI000FEA37AA|nr:hypothetical protein [Mesorhizobium sp.]RWA81300.1 MAG: hypothetical protein EOQ30_19175 [Mesorhizobium sp.]
MTKQTFLGVIITLFVVTYVSLGIDMGEALPNRTIVLVDTVQTTYVTIPCVMLETTDYPYVTNVDDVVENKAMPIAEPTVYTSTIGEARAKGFKADKHCANTGGFVTQRPWLFTLFGLGRKRVDEQGRQLW